MKEVPLTLLKHTFGKGLHVSKGALSKLNLELISINWILTSSSPLNLSCFSSNLLLTWWQTPRVLQCEVYEGPYLAFAREEIKILKWGKWLKENGSLGSTSIETLDSRRWIRTLVNKSSVFSFTLVVEDLLLGDTPWSTCYFVFACRFCKESTTTCLVTFDNK
jgi:hypothetical protein